MKDFSLTPLNCTDMCNLDIPLDIASVSVNILNRFSKGLAN